MLLGTLVGVLPGLGTMATISILLPLTYGVGDPTGSIIFMAGIYYGSQYGGSITAILLRLPGETASTVTVLDGYAMTEKGRAGAALTIAALASFLAGTVSTIVIALLAEPLSKLAFLFGPAEYASLMLLGVLACVAVTQGSMVKGLIMVGLGAFLGLVGTDVSTGHVRFTAGIPDLIDGISFTVLAIGVYGVGEILYNILKPTAGSSQPAVVDSLYPTRQELRDSAAPAVRGTALGTFLGLLPGGGNVLSSFLSYAMEKRVSKNPSQFGRGAIAGVAGPEAANNASAQSQFLPTMMLGIPVTPVMALMIAVLLINGVIPGPYVLEQNAPMFWGLIVSMWIGNLFLILLNIPLISIWIWILRIPLWILYPMILIVSLIGTYSINHSWFDMGLLVVFGLLGLILRMTRFEPTPMAMAFVIAPMFEEYFDRALLISGGSWWTFLQKPISLTFVTLAVVSVIFSLTFKEKNAFFDQVGK